MMVKLSIVFIVLLGEKGVQYVMLHMDNFSICDATCGQHINTCTIELVCDVTLGQQPIGFSNAVS